MSDYCPRCAPPRGPNRDEGGTPIIPGTLFCWRCRPTTQVGSYSVVDGQLAWTPAGRDRPRVALAVLAGREQIALRTVKNPEEVTGAVKLLLDAEGQNAELAVSVADVIQKLADGLEKIEAFRVE